MSTRLQRLRYTALVALMTVFVTPVQALKPGVLATKPLFAGTAVDPNIFFLIDDSGSMDWEVLKSNGARTAYPDESTFPDSGNLDITPTREDRDEILESCAGYNVLYYNPNVTYTPWNGVDENGDVYTDQSVTSARTNPYDADNTVNLTTNDMSFGDPPGYMTWTDADGDGEFDVGECPDPGMTGYDYNSQFRAVVGGYGPTEMTAAQKTNFANWYTYYRKREYVIKKAVLDLVQESSVRMGLGTLHDNNAVGTNIADMSNQASKTTLLDNICSMDSNGNTPLRRRLEDVGQYFDQRDVNSSISDLGITDTTPWLTQAEGGNCQQSFAIVMTDGFWNGSDPSAWGLGSGFPDDFANNEDGNNDSDYDGASYADSVGLTLADVAMYYYEEDLVTSLTNDVPSSASFDDTNPGQHLVTYGVSFGVTGSLTSNPPNRDDAFSWPTPVADELTTIDDLRHAAWNGRGQFLSAKDPETLIESMKGAVASISGRVGSAAAASFNSGDLTGDTRIFIATFNTDRWSGDLKAYMLESGTLDWSAAEVLDQRDLSADARVIYTYDGIDGVPFQWDHLNATQKSDLRTGTSGTMENEANGKARLDFIRGARGCEAGNSGACSYTDGINTFSTRQFRYRQSRLGDIVHSTPVYVGAPWGRWPDAEPFPSTSGNKYSEFMADSANRQTMVYVGSNDGMLHGFNAGTGEEEIGYVPAVLFDNDATEGLHYLSDPNYSHRYYVDNQPAYSDVFIANGVSGAAAWRSVLIGSLRTAGRGLFALDVTDPTDFSESTTGTNHPALNVLWEFTSDDDADLGVSFSRPTIVPVTGASEDTVRWVAIFGNGYNDTGEGKAKLFVLLLEGGLDGTWTLGTDYIKISTESGSIANGSCSDVSSSCNGLATPAVIDADGDGLSDRVYAGDLNGQLWVFDLSSDDMTEWGVAYKDGGTPRPLFAGPSTQPITTQPVVAPNPARRTNADTDPNVLVMFGTGQYLTSADPANTDSQSFYGVWDGGSSVPTSGTGAMLTTANLVQQTITAGTSDTTARRLTDNSVDYRTTGATANTELGWYHVLPISGERVVTRATARGDLVIYTTQIPEESPCSYGGSSWVMFAKIDDGGPPDFVAFDLNNDGTVGGTTENPDADKLDGEYATGYQVDGVASSPVYIGDLLVVTTTAMGDDDVIDVVDDDNDDDDDDITKLIRPLDNLLGRLSWEEIFLD